MKMKILAVLLALMTLCSGCAVVDLDTQDTMRPPRATGNKAGIQKVLEQYAGKNITFKYPQKGEYRSAVVFYDIKGDGGQEAIAFYTSGGSEVKETHMMVMDEVDGNWQKVDDYSNPGAEVDRLCFGDLDGDGVKEIIVGWSNTYDSISNQLTVFGYSDAQLSQYKSDYTYTEMSVMDFDGDSLDEMLLASLSVVGTPAAARLLKLSRETQQLTSAGVTELDPAVTKYAAVNAGKIAQGQPAMVLDGYKQSNQLSTEIIYWDAQHEVLRAPDTGSTLRKTSTVSKDIDGDGIIEIPIVRPMLGYSQKYANNQVASDSEEAACNIVEWCKYDVKSSAFQPVFSMVANYTDGYYFIIPDSWKTGVTAKIETETRTLTFSEWEVNEFGAGAAGAAILKIQVFSKSEWSAGKGTADFTALIQQDDKVYAASTPQSDSPYAMPFAEVMQKFNLISVS